MGSIRFKFRTTESSIKWRAEDTSGVLTANGMNNSLAKGGERKSLTSPINTATIRHQYENAPETLISPLSDVKPLYRQRSRKYLGHLPLPIRLDPDLTLDFSKTLRTCPNSSSLRNHVRRLSHLYHQNTEFRSDYIHTLVHPHLLVHIFDPYWSICSSLLAYYRSHETSVVIEVSSESNHNPFLPKESVLDRIG